MNNTTGEPRPSPPPASGSPTRARKRDAQAARLQADAEHRAAASELQGALHRMGRTGDIVNDLDERRRHVDSLAQRVQDAGLV